jgi:hypothetical protein
MTTQQTAFMMPFQVDQLSVNNFEIRDAAGHLICRVHTDESVIERNALVHMFAAAPEMRALLARLERFVDDADDEGSPLLVEIRTLLARIDGATT